MLKLVTWHAVLRITSKRLHHIQMYEGGAVSCMSTLSHVAVVVAYVPIPFIEYTMVRSPRIVLPPMLETRWNNFRSGGF